MRDLIFKNLSSIDKTRRRIVSSEIVDRQGVRSVIRRHFIYIIKEIENNRMQRPAPYLNILKELNNREQTEKFFCRIKNSIYVVHNDRLYIVLFMHSLKVTLTAQPGDLMKCQGKGENTV